MNTRRALPAAAVLALLVSVVYFSRPLPPAPPQPSDEPQQVVASLPTTTDALPTDEGEDEDEVGAPDPVEVEEGSDAAMLRQNLERWEVEGMVHATCVLDPTLPAAQGFLSIGDPEEFNGRRVIEGSDAAEAGLQEGDVIVSVDGESVAEMEVEAFVEAVGGAEGDAVTIDLSVLE
ncbi:MAG: membrane-associated protease RseP (regulator of RpoE activity) [Myxococcota bacterium]|jgi:membrane-associated protease RseP (regulator of RpoE activity)